MDPERRTIETRPIFCVHQEWVLLVFMISQLRGPSSGVRYNSILNHLFGGSKEREVNVTETPCKKNEGVSRGRPDSRSTGTNIDLLCGNYPKG